jgi:hypothetical protein
VLFGTGSDVVAGVLTVTARAVVTGTGDAAVEGTVSGTVVLGTVVLGAVVFGAVVLGALVLGVLAYGAVEGAPVLGVLGVVVESPPLLPFPELLDPDPEFEPEFEPEPLSEALDGVTVSAQSIRETQPARMREARCRFTTRPLSARTIERPASDSQPLSGERST